jgi:predicted lipid-binding transport protein (Tim44 family)
MLTPLQNPYLVIVALSSNGGLIALLVLNEISRRRERALFEKKLSDGEKKLSNCEKDSQSLSAQLQQAQSELATARAILNRRGRFIARIRPLFRQMAGDRADYKRQKEVLEEHVQQLCEELDTEDAAKERETKTDLTLEVAEIIVAHA